MKARCFLLALFIMFVAGVLVSSSYAKIDTKTCIGMWLLDENKGDLASDSSGSKNDGTLMSNPKWVDGKFGKALEFNGTNTYVDCGNANNLSIIGDLSFSMWVKISAYPAGWSNMLSKLIDDAHNEFNFRLKDATSAQFYFGFGAVAPICSWIPSEDLPLNAWTHIAGVRKSKTYLKLYFNGIEKRTAAITTDASSTVANVTIGRQSNSMFYFAGIIDDIAIFNAALEAEDIKILMDKGLKESLNPNAVDHTDKLASTWAALRK